MVANSKYTGFRTVDDAEDPGYFSNWLNEQYQQDTALRFNKQRTLELVDLQEGLIVLDGGCGIGIDAIQMAQRVGPSGHVYGVDNSQEMIAKAAANAENLELSLSFQLGDIYQLKFPDDHFDRCRVDKTFQHLSDPKAALLELVRVAKPGGKIITADPDHDSVVIDTPYSDVNHRFIRFRSDHMPQGGIAHQMAGFCQELGLIEVQVEPLTHVYTDYQQKKIASPYLDEIWVAQEHGSVTREEAEKWSAYLQGAIDAGRFLCLQTYIITTAVKPGRIRS